jgi:hypothetical protein
MCRFVVAEFIKELLRGLRVGGECVSKPVYIRSIKCSYSWGFQPAPLHYRTGSGAETFKQYIDKIIGVFKL